MDGDNLEVIEVELMGFYHVINRGVVDNYGNTGSDSSMYIPGLSDILDGRRQG
jgi:hypothetical protein